MTNNAVIRLVTFAVIIFCFFAMFLTASLSAHADFSPAGPEPAPIAISVRTAQSDVQLSALSHAEEAGAEALSMW